MQCFVFLLAGIALSTAGLPAQQSHVTRPIEPFTFDVPTGSSRAVVGLLGSATLGPGFEGSRLWIGRVREQLCDRFQDWKVHICNGFGSAHVSTSVVLGSFRPNGGVWSGDGSLALLYSVKENSVRTLAGLPQDVNAVPAIDASRLGGTLSAVATDVPGQQIAIGLWARVAECT
jgi:hypothetical protein